MTAGAEAEADTTTSAAAETALAMFEWRVEHDQSAVFILTPDGIGRSYGDIARRAGLLAKKLEEGGVSRGDTVGLYLANEPSWIVALFACWRLGAVAACCGSLTPTAEANRRFRMTDVVRVIAAAPIKAWPTTIVSAEGEVDGAGEPTAETLVPRAGLLQPKDAAVVLFTSGTTGEPKAVWRQHQRLVEQPRAAAGAYSKSAEFRPRTAPPGKAPTPSFSPFGHASAIGRLILRLYVGQTLLIIPKFNIEAMAQIAERYPVPTLHLTPAMIHELALTSLDIRFHALKYVNSGSAPLPLATRDKFEERYGVPVLQAYGSTEGAIMALEHYEDVIAGRRGPGSVGRIAKGMPYRIVDADNQDVRPGEQGELCGRMKVADGAPPNPAVDAEGWFHTGDLARVDEDGILYICGRIKEMMIVGGFNVYPGEVEEALRKFPAIREVVVVPLPDDRLGEVPVAGIVWAEVGADGDTWQEISKAARGTIEPYKVPRKWFTLKGVPRNENGKVDRKRALELATAALAEGETGKS